MPYTMVSLKKIDANTIETTYKRNGKVTGISKMTVSSEKIHVIYTDKENGTTTEYEMDKQS